MPRRRPDDLTPNQRAALRLAVELGGLVFYRPQVRCVLRDAGTVAVWSAPSKSVDTIKASGFIEPDGTRTAPQHWVVTARGRRAIGMPARP